MTQQSPEQSTDKPMELTADSAQSQPTARVLPFERPQSEVQRAVQQRAQEAMELSRARSKFQVTPVRWLVIFVIAAIPALLTSAAMDAILRGMHLLDAMYDKQDAERAAKAPPVEIQEPEVQEPGVVMLRPLAEPPPAKPADKK
ncbi:MAG TPA: hypothetical protein VGN07_10005 [Steroidobacteraceae bacterium]|jgi:hypothetical protein